MKSLFSFLVVMGASLLLVVSTITPAEAKRFGGGSSFGSKFSQSKNVKRTNSQPMQKQTASPAQQKNMQQKAKMSSRGGMMGILGGLAIGGLLGAMFFGGAFEGVNFMDILLFAFIAFILFKLLSRARGNQVATPQGTAPQEFSAEPQTGSGSNGEPATNRDARFGGITLDELRGDISRDFDKENFIEGAKSCYARLQNAWDEGDLADIRQFTTDHVFAEIQDQIRNSDKSNETKILSLNADLMSAQQLGEAMEASVLFEAHLTENGEESKTSEVWHFTRPAGALTPTWYLDGIQQVED